MAKYTITHACGHTDEVNLFGKHAERERKIAYLESIDCRACWDAAQAAQAKEAGLPDLTGSPKQIAWANGIRNRILAEAAHCIETHPDWPNMDKWLSELKKETAARWWIDHRDAHAASLHGDWALAQEAKILKCVISFINVDNGDEDAFKTVPVPPTAILNPDPWMAAQVKAAEPTKDDLDKKFGAKHTVALIILEDGKEVFRHIEEAH